MRVLIVAKQKREGFAPFVKEQIPALERAEVECESFCLKGHGIFGYLKNLPALKRKIKECKPGIIHAHYGLSGLLANFQRRIPVVTTYHGSDINDRYVRRFSRLAMALSAHNIFVSRKCIESAGVKRKYSLIPCGVDMSVFMPVEKVEARRKLGMDEKHKIALFAGAFDDKVKNPELAKAAVACMTGVELKELKGFTREQVALMMNAADVLLMTSFSEGSPQVIKEAMACGCPIVSVDVGDVKEMTDGIDGCFMVRRTPEDVASGIRFALTFGHKTTGRDRLDELGLSDEQVAGRLVKVYENIIEEDYKHS